MDDVAAVPVHQRKAQLRARIRRQRRASGGSDAAAFAGIAERLAWWAMVRGAGVAAAYASFGDEPPTTALLEELRAASLRVLLPVMRDDGDLDWSPYAGADDLVVDRRGIPSPSGPRYGPQAIAGADLVIVPALAVDEDGHRLGRGAGCYDRALARVRSDVPLIALLHDGELLPPGSVPAEEHDVRVTHVCSPGGGLRAVGTG